MREGPFTPAEMRPLLDGMTVSRGAGLSERSKVTWFSLGSGTAISAERYDVPILYIGSVGTAVFLLGEHAEPFSLGPGQCLVVPPSTLCGIDAGDGVIYTEIILSEDTEMLHMIPAGKSLELKDLAPYAEGSIVNKDILINALTKYVVMAFDEGTALAPHRAPGEAIITILEGKAIVGYDGQEYSLQAGESFHFAKDVLHSVKADGRFKMTLLLVLE